MQFGAALVSELLIYLLTNNNNIGGGKKIITKKVVHKEPIGSVNRQYSNMSSDMIKCVYCEHEKHLSKE